MIGDDQNNYIKGSNRNLNRFEDGHDILDGGAGDDVLDGGRHKSSVGGYIIDLYKFDQNYGFDRVFNFFAEDIYESYGSGGYPTYEAGIKSDKIEIPNDVVSSATSIINSSVNDKDGFAHLTFAQTDIVIHMVSKEQLKPDYFFITPRTINSINGTDDHDFLIGTDSNDRIQGSERPFDRFEDGSDFLEGGKGNDILIGGPAKRPTGGWMTDKYRFNDDFGNDYLISFFAQDLTDGGGNRYNPDGDGAEQSDRLEFNKSLASTATEIIDSAVNNEDGWAKIIIGSNSLTIFGVSKEDLKPDYFHIVPSIENNIYGTSDDSLAETLTGTSGNDYIHGGSATIGRQSDGPDTLIGKEGDDVLMGGPNKRGFGGFDIDTYVFEANSGNDLIIGFLFDGTGYVNEYNDIIELPYNVNGSGISSFDDLLASTTNNADGWAVIDLGDNNSITLHGVPKEKLLARNFNITGVPEGDSPEVTNFTISSSNIDLSNGDVELTYTFDISDASGVEDSSQYVEILQSTGTGQQIWSYNLEEARVSGDSKNGSYSITVTVDADESPPGDYLARVRNLSDIWGNTCANCSTLELIITNENSEGDSPVISNYTISSKNLTLDDDGTEVVFNFDITDESGVDESYTADRIYVSKNNSGYSYSLDLASIRTSGDNKSGSYELQVIFTRENHPPGTYSARLQGIRDIFGNTASSLFINDIVINHEKWKK